MSERPIDQDSLQEDSHDWSMLHYATGILMGIGAKHGAIDVVIYHNGIRVRIERVAGAKVTAKSEPELIDEIERLRAQVVSLQTSLDAGPPIPGKKTPNALEDP